MEKLLFDIGVKPLDKDCVAREYALPLLKSDNNVHCQLNDDELVMLTSFVCMATNNNNNNNNTELLSDIIVLVEDGTRRPCSEAVIAPQYDTSLRELHQTLTTELTAGLESQLISDRYRQYNGAAKWRALFDSAGVRPFFECIEEENDQTEFTHKSLTTSPWRSLLVTNDNADDETAPVLVRRDTHAHRVVHVARLIDQLNKTDKKRAIAAARAFWHAFNVAVTRFPAHWNTADVSCVRSSSMLLSYFPRYCLYIFLN